MYIILPAVRAGWASSQTQVRSIVSMILHGAVATEAAQTMSVQPARHSTTDVQPMVRIWHVQSHVALAQMRGRPLIALHTALVPLVTRSAHFALTLSLGFSLTSSIATSTNVVQSATGLQMLGKVPVQIAPLGNTGCCCLRWTQMAVACFRTATPLHAQLISRVRAVILAVFSQQKHRQSAMHV